MSSSHFGWCLEIGALLARSRGLSQLDRRGAGHWPWSGSAALAPTNNHGFRPFHSFTDASVRTSSCCSNGVSDHNASDWHPIVSQWTGWSGRAANSGNGLYERINCWQM